MMTFLKACAKNERYIITHPERRRDFVHIDNFCKQLETLIGDKNYRKQYYATGQLTSFWKVACILQSIENGRKFPNVVVVDDYTTNFDWHPVDPVFDDTLREDMEREWKRLLQD